MLSARLPTVEINPAVAPVAVVIWLHGLGADGHDFEPIVPELRLSPSPPFPSYLPFLVINGGRRITPPNTLLN